MLALPRPDDGVQRAPPPTSWVRTTASARPCSAPDRCPPIVPGRRRRPRHHVPRRRATGGGRCASAAASTKPDGGSPGLDTAGRMTTRLRYVRTNAFANERRRGGKLYFGMEGTRTATATTSADRRIGNDLSSPPFYRHHLPPGLNKMGKDTSNTRAVYFGRRLLALWSGGLPYKQARCVGALDGGTVPARRRGTTRRSVVGRQGCHRLEEE